MNKLGIKKIEYLPEEKCTMPFPSDTCNAGYLADEFKELAHRALSASMSDDQSSEPAGVKHTVKVTGRLALSSVEHDHILRLLSLKPMVFKVTDMNDTAYLVGSNHYAARFTFKRVINEMAFNGYEFEITHSSPHGALIIV